jgi:hypothetical protein
MHARFAERHGASFIYKIARLPPGTQAAQKSRDIFFTQCILNATEPSKGMDRIS